MTNEAAERLRQMFEGFSDPDTMHTDLDAALTVERRSMVERIRRRIAQFYELTPDGAGLRGFIEGTLDSLDG